MNLLLGTGVANALRIAHPFLTRSCLAQLDYHLQGIEKYSLAMCYHFAAGQLTTVGKPNDAHFHIHFPSWEVYMKVGKMNDPARPRRLLGPNNLLPTPNPIQGPYLERRMSSSHHGLCLMLDL